MSRYPFIQCVNRYLLAEEGHSGDETLETANRRLRQLGKIFEELKDQGNVGTTDPRYFTPEDIDAFVGFRKKIGIESATIVKDLAYLKKLLSFCDNSSVERFKAKYPSHVPRVYHQRLDSMDEELVQRIIKRSMSIDLEDWKMMEAYGLVVLAICAGLRAKELRMADRANIRFDSQGATIRLIHVKGEATYGQKRTVPIHQDGIPALKRYLEAREAKLAKENKKEKALFPPIKNDGGYLSYNTIRKLKKLVEEDLGEPFDYRECRRTFGQRAVDEGQDFTNISIVMGHSSPQTTYKNYCGQRPERAVMEMQRYWQDNDGTAKSGRG